MVSTAIHFESSGNYYIPFNLSLVECLRVVNHFRRQLDGLLRMAVLMALLKLLGAVSPCKKIFFPFRFTIMTHLEGLSVEFAGHLALTSQLLLHTLQKISM
jgi:hypothetical protein